MTHNFQSGFYEDRSPSLYIRLPPRFITEHPSLVQNLRENADKITSPYDLHITLRHILSLSTKKQMLLKAVGCSHCRSLFQEVPSCRRCQDAAIPVSSCPCSYQRFADVHDKKVVLFAANFALKILNTKIGKMKEENGENCARFELVEITDAYEQMATQFDVNYIIRFIVSPTKSHFEATVRRKLTTLISTTPQFELLGEIVHMNENTQPIICVSASGKKFNRRFEDEVEDYFENEEFWTSRSFPDY